MDLSGLFHTMRGKTILAINPPVHDFAYFDLWAKPMGLLLLLQQLREQENRVELIDCLHEARSSEKSYGRFKTQRFAIPKPEVYSTVKRKYYHFGLNDDAFSLRLREVEKPDYILITSVMTYWYPGVAWCLPFLREAFPNVPIFLGGIYAQLCPDHAATLGVDAVQTTPLSIKATYPALDLYAPAPYGILTTSYGCPLSCDYCASKRLWPEFSRRALEAVQSDFEYQFKLGIQDMSFYDDALLIDKERHFYPLCEELLKPSGLRFHTPNGLHVRQMDARCAQTLWDSRFKTIRLSLEGVDPQIQSASTAKVLFEEYKEAVSNLENAGYAAHELETYILAGIPGQNPSAIANSIQHVLELGATPKIAEFSPIPQTVLFDEALKTVPQLLQEPLLQNNTIYCTHVGKTIDPDTLQHLKNLARRGRLK